MEEYYGNIQSLYKVVYGLYNCVLLGDFNNKRFCDERLQYIDANDKIRIHSMMV